jgi:hypothetical protein
LTKPDNDWGHLYPMFRIQLQKVLKEVSEASGMEWTLVEGYRSHVRQLYLFAQGRTRPGKIVTWLRSPKWHGTGLAADVMPKRLGYKAHRKYWELLRVIYRRHGLENPAWEKGDLGHIQLSDSKMRLEALAWVKRGFK